MDSSDSNASRTTELDMLAPPEPRSRHFNRIHNGKEGPPATIFLKILHIGGAIDGLVVQNQIFVVAAARTVLYFSLYQHTSPGIISTATAAKYLPVVNSFLIGRAGQVLMRFANRAVLQRYLYIIRHFKNFKSGVAKDLRQGLLAEDNAKVPCNLQAAYGVLVAAGLYLALLMYNIAVVDEQSITLQIVCCCVSFASFVVFHFDEYKARAVLDKLREELLHQRYLERTRPALTSALSALSSRAVAQVQAQSTVNRMSNASWEMDSVVENALHYGELRREYNTAGCRNCGHRFDNDDNDDNEMDDDFCRNCGAQREITTTVAAPVRRLAQRPRQAAVLRPLLAGGPPSVL
jgi:hypothetical protein